MKKYIFRNTAMEYLFNEDYVYSGYGDVSIDNSYDEYYFCYFILLVSNPKSNTSL